MYLQVKSSSGITLVPSESLLLEKRIVFIENSIDSTTAAEFCKSMMILCSDKSNKPINVMINSNGGEINAGLLIYDIIQSCKVPVNTYCIGKAYSMAAIIFMAGTGERCMLPNSELMLHEPLLGNKIEGNTSTIRSISDWLLEIKDKMVGIIVKHTENSKEEVEKAIDHDHYYSPEESIEFGMADGISGFDKMIWEED